MGMIKFKKGQDPRGDQVPKDAKKMGEVFVTEDGRGYLLPRKGVSFISLLTVIMAFVKTYFDQIVGIEDEIATKEAKENPTKTKLPDGREFPTSIPKKIVSIGRVLRTEAYIIHDFLIERLENEQEKQQKPNSGVLVPKEPSGIILPKK